VVLLLLLSLASTSLGQVTLCVPTTGSNATSVLGQALFTTSAAGVGLFEMKDPSAVLVDPSTQKTYVSDQGNNRILRFSSTNALVTNGSADLILFGNNTVGVCNTSTLDGPDQMAYLGTDLYFADGNNNRVLKLANAPTTNSTIMSPTLVLGSATTNTCMPISNALQDLAVPSGVAINNNASLYVSEASSNGMNCWIKRFDNASVFYATPNSLLGTGACSLSVPTLSTVSGTVYHLFVEPTLGHLFAADYGFARVLLYKYAHLKGNATGVIDTVFGKANGSDTTTGVCNSTTGLAGPVGVYYDTAGDTLIVSDQALNRVVFYINALLVLNGTANSLVLGQPTQTAQSCNFVGTSQANISGPAGVFYDNNFPGVFLMVVDQSNRRVMRYQCANSTFSASITISKTLAATSPGSSSGAALSSSGAVANSSSGAVASSSGAVASSSGAALSSSGVVASSSGAAGANSSSGAVAPSSSGAAVNASSSGAAGANSSSGAVAPSSSGVVAPSSSGAALSITATTSTSQSNTPSETNPQNTATATPIAPPPVQPSGAVVKAPVCGNGAIETGEECDAGSAVPRTKCCTSICTNLAVRSICGRATSQCTKRPKCGKSLNSRQLVCNPGVAKPVGTHCGRGGIFSRKTCKADGSCSK